MRVVFGMELLITFLWIGNWDWRRGFGVLLLFLLYSVGILGDGFICWFRELQLVTTV